MSITFHDLEKLLHSHKNITDVENKPDGSELFNRVFYFNVSGNVYLIYWYKNICYLHIDTRCIIVFHTVEISNSWPNSAKLNLQFSDNSGYVICILPIEQF